MGCVMLDHRLETFMQVVKDGSFSKAAGNLYLSSVSVMKQMDSLESYIGVKLFVRTNHGIELTPSGKELYEGAQRIVFLSERVLNQVRDAGQEQRVIRVGTSTIRPCRPLLELWSRIGGDKLPFRFEIVSFDDDTASLNELSNTLGKRIDCFIAPCDSTRWRENCGILVLDYLDFCLAFPREHPLSKKSSLTWSDIDGESIILTPGDDSPVVKRLREDICENHPLVHIVDHSTHFDIATFNKCVQGGFGVQSYSVWDDVHPSLVRVPVEWEYTMPYGIVYSANPTPAVSSFIAVIRNWITDHPAEQPGKG